MPHPKTRGFGLAVVVGALLLMGCNPTKTIWPLRLQLQLLLLRKQACLRRHREEEEVPLEATRPRWQCCAASN